MPIITLFVPGKKNNAALEFENSMKWGQVFFFFFILEFFGKLSNSPVNLLFWRIIFLLNIVMSSNNFYM